jgi:hypothetical protein
MDETEGKVKRRKLEAALSSARATVALLEAELEDIDDIGDGSDPLLDLESVEAEGLSPHTARTWIKSGRLEAYQAERGRFVFRRSALMKAIEASPVMPRERKAKPPADLAAWEAEADRAIGGAW